MFFARILGPSRSAPSPQMAARQTKEKPSAARAPAIFFPGESGSPASALMAGSLRKPAPLVAPYSAGMHHTKTPQATTAPAATSFMTDSWVTSASPIMNSSPAK